VALFLATKVAQERVKTKQNKTKQNKIRKNKTQIWQQQRAQILFILW
jgi:hypothetical protein